MGRKKLYKNKKERIKAYKKSGKCKEQWMKWYNSKRKMTPEEEMYRNTYIRELYARGESAEKLSKYFSISLKEAKEVIINFYK